MRVCLVVPPLLRAGTGTNVIKQGGGSGMSKDDHVAR